MTIDLTVPDIAQARNSYAHDLGLAEDDLGLDWVTRFVGPQTGEHT